MNNFQKMGIDECPMFIWSYVEEDVQSTVVFGRCHLIEAGDYAITLLKRFAMKYYPSEQLVDEEIARAGENTQIFEIEIEHIRGKEVQER